MTVAGFAACGSQTTPAPTPVPTPSPLKITCPAASTITSPAGQPLPVHYATPTTAGGTAPVQIACTPANDSIFPIGSTTVMCTATDAKSTTDSCSLGVTVSAPARITLVRFVAFGDSMTAGEITDPNAVAPFFDKLVLVPSKSYPADLQTELSTRYTAQSITVDNAGVQGESVRTKTTEPRLVSVLSSGAYQVLLLMEGANDINSRDSATIAPTIAIMDRMVRDATSRGIRVFLATLPPQNPLGPLGTCAILVQPYNDSLKSVAAADNATLVDVYQAFGGDTTTLIGPDGLHPTVAGYQRIADTFFASIKQTLELPGSPATLSLPPVNAATRR